METLDQNRMESLLARIRQREIDGGEDYERKLRDNIKNPTRFSDLCTGGDVALMFRAHGWKVRLQESPDLELEIHGHRIYAKVKTFHEKEQDRADDTAMAAAGDLLVPVGDTFRTEGDHAFKQLANVAKRKVEQYVEGAFNILVVVSESPSLELMAQSAVNEIDDEVSQRACDSRLRRLNGILLINNTGWSGFGPDPSNIEFAQTSNPSLVMPRELAAALRSIDIH